MKGVKLILVIGFLVSIIAISSSSGATCSGDGWVNRNNQKCFKIIKSLLAQSEAEKACQDLYNSTTDLDMPTLLQINLPVEQEYLTNYIFNTSAAPVGVWTGAMRDGSSLDFKWADGSLVSYANWAVDSPSGNLARGCVEMESSISRTVAGEWRDVTCFKGNWVVCQKTPSWSTKDIIYSIIKLEEFKEQMNNSTN